jgi:hypothetical protein
MRAASVRNLRYEPRGLQPFGQYYALLPTLLPIDALVEQVIRCGDSDTAAVLYA